MFHLCLCEIIDKTFHWKNKQILNALKSGFLSQIYISAIVRLSIDFTHTIKTVPYFFEFIS